MTEEDVFDSPTGWVAKHIKRYEASDGANGHVYLGVPCLLLTRYLKTAAGKCHEIPLFIVERR